MYGIKEVHSRVDNVPGSFKTGHDDSISKIVDETAATQLIKKASEEVFKWNKEPPQLHNSPKREDNVVTEENGHSRTKENESKAIEDTVRAAARGINDKDNTVRWLL